MTITINATSIIYNDTTIQNTASLSNISNLGAGANVYYSKSGSNAQLRILFNTSGSLTQTGNVITFIK